MKRKTCVKLLNTSQFNEEALNLLGASSPLTLINKTPSMGEYIYISVVITGRDLDFRKVNLAWESLNSYTVVLGGNVLEWQNLFINSELSGTILDQIFDVLKKGNNIFKLIKVGERWKLK